MPKALVAISIVAMSTILTMYFSNPYYLFLLVFLFFLK